MYHRQLWVLHDHENKHLVGLLHTLPDNIIDVKLNNVLIFRELMKKTETEKICIFFIDNEQYELRITKKEGRFFYQLEGLEYARTKAGQRKKYKMIAAGILVPALVFLCLGLMFGPRIMEGNKIMKNKKRLLQEGQKTLAKVIAVGEGQPISQHLQYKSNAPKRHIYYQFSLSDTVYSGSIPLKKDQSGNYYTDIGFPIRKAQEFWVHYVPDEPSINELWPTKPSNKVLQHYQELAINVCQKSETLPTYPKVDVYCQCLTYYVYEYFGILGLAKIYNQQTPFSKHPHYNQNTYRHFLKNAHLVEILDYCESQQLVKQAQ